MEQLQSQIPLSGPVLHLYWFFPYFSRIWLPDTVHLLDSLFRSDTCMTFVLHLFNFFTVFQDYTRLWWYVKLHHSMPVTLFYFCYFYNTKAITLQYWHGHPTTLHFAYFELILNTVRFLMTNVWWGTTSTSITCTITHWSWGHDRVRVGLKQIPQ